MLYGLYCFKISEMLQAFAIKQDVLPGDCFPGAGFNLQLPRNKNSIRTAKEDNMTDNANFTSLGQAFSLGNGQESALNWLREKKIPVAVFLISGIKLEGVITSHDQYSLLLTDARGIQQLIYKAKISTITQVTASKPRSGRPFTRSGGRPGSPDQSAPDSRRPPQAN